MRATQLTQRRKSACGGQLYGTVLPGQDGRGFSMWHQCAATYGNCFANSTDGIHWTRPDLGLIGGSADSSMVLTRVDSTATPNTVCTAVKSLAKGAKKTTCRDTQPSVLFTPQLSGAEYQMFVRQKAFFGHHTSCLTLIERTTRAEQNFNYGQDMDTKCPSGVACDKDGYCRCIVLRRVHST